MFSVKRRVPRVSCWPLSVLCESRGAAGSASPGFTGGCFQPAACLAVASGFLLQDGLACSLRRAAGDRGAQAGVIVPFWSCPSQPEAICPRKTAGASLSPPTPKHTLCPRPPPARRLPSRWSPGVSRRVAIAEHRRRAARRASRRDRGWDRVGSAGRRPAPLSARRAAGRMSRCRRRAGGGGEAGELRRQFPRPGGQVEAGAAAGAWKVRNDPALSRGGEGAVPLPPSSPPTPLGALAQCSTSRLLPSGFFSAFCREIAASGGEI